MAHLGCQAKPISMMVLKSPLHYADRKDSRLLFVCYKLLGLKVDCLDLVNQAKLAPHFGQKMLTKLITSAPAKN